MSVFFSLLLPALVLAQSAAEPQGPKEILPHIKDPFERISEFAKADFVRQGKRGLQRLAEALNEGEVFESPLDKRQLTKNDLIIAIDRLNELARGRYRQILEPSFGRVDPNKKGIDTKTRFFKHDDRHFRVTRFDIERYLGARNDAERQAIVVHCLLSADLGFESPDFKAASDFLKSDDVDLPDRLRTLVQAEWLLRGVRAQLSNPGAPVSFHPPSIAEFENKIRSAWASGELVETYRDSPRFLGAKWSLLARLSKSARLHLHEDKEHAEVPLPHCGGVLRIKRIKKGMERRYDIEVIDAENCNSLSSGGNKDVALKNGEGTLEGYNGGPVFVASSENNYNETENTWSIDSALVRIDGLRSFKKDGNGRVALGKVDCHGKKIGAWWRSPPHVGEWDVAVFHEPLLHRFAVKVTPVKRGCVNIAVFGENRWAQYRKNGRGTTTLYLPEDAQLMTHRFNVQVKSNSGKSTGIADFRLQPI